MDWTGLDWTGRHLGFTLLRFFWPAREGIETFGMEREVGKFLYLGQLGDHGRLSVVASQLLFLNIVGKMTAFLFLAHLVVSRITSALSRCGSLRVLAL